MGRALGYGTRHLAKTIAAVAEAASSPDTSSPVARPAERSDSSRVSIETPARSISSDLSDLSDLKTSPARVGRRSQSSAPAGAGREHLKRSLLQPLAAYSGALWLRVTGIFFALLAFTLGTGAWRVRPDLHTPGSLRAAHHLWIFLAFASLFGYFAVSSFLRASRLERNATVRR